MAETQCILVVEDDIDTAEMLSAYFEAQGQGCVIFHNAQFETVEIAGNP